MSDSAGASDFGVGAAGAERMMSKIGGIANRWLIVAAFLVLFFLGLGRPPLLEPDEGRYVEIPREMLVTGDFLTPRLNGVLYFEKPPLYYWLNAMAIALFGLGEFAGRFWSAVSGALGAGIAYSLGRSIFGRQAGAAAAAILASIPIYLVCSRLTLIDMTLALLIEFVLTCCWFAVSASSRSGTAKTWWIGAAAAAGAAVLTKGLIGIVIPAAVVLIYLTLTREWRRLLFLPWFRAAFVFCVVSIPWHVLMALRYPDFLRFYFVQEHFQRYLTPISEREQPVYFFAVVLVVGALPWSGAMLASARRSWGGRGALGEETRRAYLFLLTWAAFPVLFFSLSKSKLIPYVLPALAPLAVLLAAELARLWQEAEAYVRRALHVGLTMALLLGTAASAASFGWFGERAQVVGGGRWVVLSSVAVLLALALGLNRLGKGFGRAIAATAVGGVALCAALVPVATSVAGPKLMSRQLVHRFGSAFERSETVVAYGYYPQSLPVYLNRTISVASFAGECAYGISRLPDATRQERFPNDHELCAGLAGIDGEVVVVAQSKLLPPACRRLAGAKWLRDGDFVVIHAGPAPRSGINTSGDALLVTPAR